MQNIEKRNKAIVDLYKRGWTIADLAEMFIISIADIAKILIDNDIKPTF